MPDDLLTRLDDLRRATGDSSADGRVRRETSPDGTECRIVFTRCAPAQLDELISAEKARADTLGYALEWKTYGHDVPTELPGRLLAAGFRADDAESVLTVPLTRIAAFGGGTPHDIRRVHDLADYAEVSRQIGRTNVEEEAQQLAAVMRDTPDRLSVYVAYVDGEPASCGRVYFHPGSPFAELAGGRTIPTRRRLGLFTALVAARLHEARDRGCTHAIVDALPTSEPILTKRGFERLTTTTPYLYG
jgi:hypothetical protein